MDDQAYQSLNVVHIVSDLLHCKPGLADPHALRTAIAGAVRWYAVCGPSRVRQMATMMLQLHGLSLIIVPVERATNDAAGRTWTLPNICRLSL